MNPLMHSSSPKDPTCGQDGVRVTWEDVGLCSGGRVSCVQSVWAGCSVGALLIAKNPICSNQDGL